MVVSLDSVYEIRTTRACLLSPSEPRDTVHLRSALWSAPSVTVVRGWRPAVRGSKRRNSLTRCAPWPKVIRFPEPHPREGLDRPTMPAGMTDKAWPMEALLSYRLLCDLHTQLDQCAINVTSLPFYTRYRGTPPKYPAAPRLSPSASGITQGEGASRLKQSMCRKGLRVGQRDVLRGRNRWAGGSL